MSDTLRIRTQATPNPNAWKFVLDRPVKIEGKISYQDPEAAAHVPLAASLLRLANVTQVHLFDNVITVTQNGASDWEILDPAVQKVIKDLFASHDPAFPDVLSRPKTKPDLASLSPELQLVEEILERTVRPGLRADGGDLEVVELDGNILTIRYEGACGGCPSSMMGTLQAIESILRDEFNPYLEVVAI